MLALERMGIYMNLKPMLNAYPDSLGGTLGDIVTLLKQDDMKGVFGSFYILPSLYHSDLDRGFSVIDYDINEELAERDDLEALKEVGIDLKLDFILNHASAQSPQFKDLVEKGDASEYKNFFIDWNAFWEGRYVFSKTGASDSDGTVSRWNQTTILEYILPGRALSTVSGTDGSGYSVSEGMGFLSGNTCKNRFLWRKYCAAGCFCLCPKGSWTEKFPE